MPILKIAIAKGGKGAFYEVDSDIILSEDFSREAYQRIIEEGLKALLNTRMTKLKAPTKLEGEEFEENQQAALEQAAENFKDLCANKLVKKSSAKAKSAVPREVMTEAVRLAREVIRNELSRAGKKVSLIAASDITREAKALVEMDETYISMARKAIEERAQIAAGVLNLSSITESPTKVAKAEKAKAERKAQLSAKQAANPKPHKGGKVPPRRPQTTAPHANH